MAIVEDIKQTYRRDVSVAAVYMTLKRLQNEGLIKSKMSDVIKKRGGRKKSLYFVLGPGRHYLKDYYDSVTLVWHDLEHYLAEHRFI
jgi:DNA-binding PadR family transcriptional regulator